MGLSWHPKKATNAVLKSVSHLQPDCYLQVIIAEGNPHNISMLLLAINFKVNERDLPQALKFLPYSKLHSMPSLNV